MNISKGELEQISMIFPDLTNILYEGESNVYERYCVSVFDHVLSEDEVGLIYPEDNSEINSRQEKFKCLIQGLYESTPIYTWKFRRNRKNKLSIKKPRSYTSFIRKCHFNELTEQYGDVFSFIIPEYSLIYTQYYDWTHIVESLEENKLNLFKEKVKEAGLYCW